ncbi:RCC1 domain-containing protein 1 [Mortierella sp. GBA30]|nr:RCC1 domain-containing protein 1 [Mortierella sp. GBA30]
MSSVEENLQHSLLLNEPIVSFQGAIDVAACGRSRDHWTVVIDRQGRLHQWTDSDPEPKPVPLPQQTALSAAGTSGFLEDIVFTQVWAGEAHMLALDTKHVLYSWGSGRHGQLGHGDLVSLSTPTAIEALQGINIVSAACGASFSIAASSSGDIYSFGLNDHGQLGIGKQPSSKPGNRDTSPTRRNTALPQLVDFCDEDSKEPLDLTITQVGCGSAHAVALDDEGCVWTCGWGKYGQLGDFAAPEFQKEQKALKMLLSTGGDTARVDQFLFKKVKVDGTLVSSAVTCGLWSTFLREHTVREEDEDE